MGTYFWSLGASQIQLLQASGILAFLFGLPFWVAMTRFIDKGSAFLFGIGLLTIFTMLSPLLQIIGWYPPPESPAYRHPGRLHHDRRLWRHCGGRQCGFDDRGCHR